MTPHFFRARAEMPHTPILSSLPDQHEVDAIRRRDGFQKPIPHPLAKIEKRKTKAAREKEFRAAVWDRDRSRSRASQKPLVRSGTNWERVGEVHHVIPRSLAPERVSDVANGLLLSKEEHALAETNCPADPSKCLLDILGSEDRSLPQTFIFYDVQGNELRRRIG